VANLRSLRDEQELSFVAPLPDPAADADGVANARVLELSDGTSLPVYPLLGVFGANASGKSNVVAAMKWMREAVLNSYAQWAALPAIPRDAFALDRQASAETTLCEVDFVLADGVRWTYGFEVGTRHVEAEWLFAYPKGRRQVWLDREADRPEVFEFPGKRLHDSARLARTTRANALLLSQAATGNHPQLSPIYDWFKQNLWDVTPESEREQRERFTAQFLQDQDTRARIVELLRVADLGISGAEVTRRSEVRLLHEAAGAGEPAVPLDWQYESFGTRSWFALLGPLLLALDVGAVLLIDELDSSLHPRFAAEVVRLFQTPWVNKRGAQLVFTAHDPSLLRGSGSLRLLEPGQVWLTEKDERGATSLYPLSDLEPTAEEDLMSGYLDGSYGAVPRISEGRIGRSLLASEPVRESGSVREAEPAGEGEEY
jgi:hypothetical protein